MARSTLGQVWHDKWLILCIALVIMLGGMIIIPQQGWTVFGPTIARVATSEKVVALTFDDGPTQPQTNQLLDILEDERIKATFYLIGAEMKRSPQATDAIIAAGHEIGNHSYSHSSLAFMGYNGEAQEIEKTDALIRQHGYAGPITIRPPYGHKFWELPLYAALHNRQIIMWDFALGNMPGISSSDILNEAKKRTRPGSIIIMHPMYEHNKITLESVRPLVRELKASGYRFVTISELLGYQLGNISTTE